MKTLKYQSLINFSQGSNANTGLAAKESVFHSYLYAMKTQNFNKEKNCLNACKDRLGAPHAWSMRRALAAAAFRTQAAVS